MELSEIINVVLGGGLCGAVISIMTIRSALKKAKAEAEKALADSDTVKITNTEQATRILIQNIVDPLKEELNETRKDLDATKREMARLRKAIDEALKCKYSDDCPVLIRMRSLPKEREVENKE
jgi:peptidoglycan hydrolase CwlO-like protein